MSQPKEQLTVRLLQWLARVVCRHPGWFLYPQIILAGLCVYYTIKNLEFDTNRDNLVGGDKKYHQNFLKYKKEFPLQDDLVVVVESEDKEKNRQFVERLGARLELETNLFTDVVFKGDLKMLGAKALLFVPEGDLTEMRLTLRDYRPFLEQFTQATNLPALFNLVNRQFLNAQAEQNAQNDSLVKALPALERILAQAGDSLQRRGVPPSPGITALFGGGAEAENKMYITYANDHIYLVTARAKDEASNEGALRTLRSLVAQTQSEVPGLNVGVTGGPILEIDEMEQSQTDSMLATIISLALVALIFVYGYHETGRPLKATVSLLLGLAYTMAFTTWTVGHLNILTITFAPILIGLAIDFGVHLITRYEEELRHGRSPLESLQKAMVYTGQGIFTGALTTAGAFLAMGATNFKGIQEMGVICGSGLIICLVPMMTFLPVMLLRGRQNIIDHKLGAALDRREWIENLWLTRPRTTIITTIGLCLACLIPASHVYFDYNLLNMQSDGLPSVITEKKLISSAKKSVLYGAIMADSLAEAVAVSAQLTNLSSVASVDLAGIEQMAQYLTEDQTRKLQIVGEIKRDISQIHFAPADRGPIDLRDFTQTLWSLNGYLSLAMAQVKTADPAIYQQLRSLSQTITDLRRQMLMADPAVVTRQLAVFQQALFDDVRVTFETIQTQDNRARLTTDDLPPALRKRFLGVTGKYLVQVYPKKDCWQRDHQKEFVEQLRSVEDKVTGTPVQLLEYTTLLKSSYQEAAGYSLIAIVILVLIHFRSVACVILSLLPVGIGALWMVGFMGLFNIPFNPANIMTLPLIIGVGVTNGIHILNRFAEERHPGILAKSTGKAVLISGLTTIAGFGSLVLAKHRGIESLGYVMAVGTTTCMIAGLTFLPALLNVMIRRGWSIKKPSGDNATTTGSGGTEVKTSSVNRV